MDLKLPMAPKYLPVRRQEFILSAVQAGIRFNAIYLPEQAPHPADQTSSELS